MVFTTILLIAAFLLFAAVCGFLGSQRGIVRQLIRAGMMLLSFVCAIYFAKLCTDAAMAWMDHKTAADLLVAVDKCGDLLMSRFGVDISSFRALVSYIDPSTLNYVLAIPFSLIISPLMFPLLFIIFLLLTLIPYFIICGSVGLIKLSKKKG